MKRTLEETPGNEKDLDKVVKLGKRPKQFYELHPEYIVLDLERFKNTTNTNTSKIKGGSKIFDEARRIIPQINEQLINKQNFGDVVKVTRNKKEQERLEKVQESKRHINNVARAVELISGGYTLGRGIGYLSRNGLRTIGTTYNRYNLPIRTSTNPYIRLSNRLNDLLQQSDKGQVLMNTLGTTADIMQEATEKTNWVNKAEIVGGTAGIIGGLNIVRNTPWFGRHRKAIDTTLDGLGYSAAGYDVGNWLLSD